MKKILIISLIIFAAFTLTVQVFAELGDTPDSEKSHTVAENDTLANISYQYYTNDDRERGAHWIHIYEYSVDKNLIDPEKQPIIIYGRADARVNIYIDKKVAIPIFKGQYPSANALLNKYGFELGDDRTTVKKIEDTKEDTEDTKEDTKEDSEIEVDTDGDEIDKEIGGEINIEKSETEDKDTGLPIDIDYAGVYQFEGEKQEEDSPEIKFLTEYDEIQLTEDTVIAKKGDKKIEGTLKKNDDDTITITLPIEDEEGKEKEMSITVTPKKEGDKTYFIYSDKEYKFKKDEKFEVLTEWAGKYKDGVEEDVEDDVKEDVEDDDKEEVEKDDENLDKIAQLEKELEEKEDKLKELELEGTGYSLELKDDQTFTLVTNLVGKKTQHGDIEVVDKNRMILKLNDGTELTVLLSEKDGKKILEIKKGENTLFFTKID